MGKRRKLITPNGNLITISQINRLNISKIFDFLIEIGVTDKAHRNTFFNLKNKKFQANLKFNSSSNSLKKIPSLNKNIFTKVDIISINH